MLSPIIWFQRPGLMSINEGYFFTDGSCMTNSYHQYGTLLVNTLLCLQFEKFSFWFNWQLFYNIFSFISFFFVGICFSRMWSTSTNLPMNGLWMEFSCCSSLICYTSLKWCISVTSYMATLNQTIFCWLICKYVLYYPLSKLNVLLSVGGILWFIPSTNYV